MQPLQINHDPVRVIIFTMDGPLLGLKITLRCKSCQLNYRYDKYGGEGGYRHYDSTREFATASNLCYIQRELCEQWMAAVYVIRLSSARCCAGILMIAEIPCLQILVKCHSVVIEKL